MTTMTSILHRRNSMSELSLYDLERFPSKIQSEAQPSKSLLENLCNELLIDIFSYLSPYDLHRSLYNLNSHFDAICEIQELSLDLSGSKCEFDYYYSNQQPFALQIYSLKLDDQYHRLNLFHQHITIDFFTNLRTLIIREPSSENLDKILPKLHTFSHLSSLSIDSALLQSQDITENIFRIRSLKHLLLDSIDPIILHLNPHSSPPFTELEYIEVDLCSVVQFLELLKYVGPKLKRMKVYLRYDPLPDETATISPTIIDEWLSNHQTSVFLDDLEVKVNFLLLTNFHLLLRLFPHLRRLTCVTLTDDIDFISPSIWYEFISNNLLKLTKLQFHADIIGLLGNIVQCPSTDLIDAFHSMNNKWLAGSVVMDYHALLKEPVLKIFTHPLSVRLERYSLEVYGRRRYIATAMADVPINIDEKVAQLSITLNDDLLSSYETSDVKYPKVTGIIIHSQMTRQSNEDDKKSKSIISDLVKSIPDLSKITSLTFTSDSSIYPSTILTRRLLDKFPKVTGLELPYEYLLSLLKSPIIVKLLNKKISSLTIEFKLNPPQLPDMIRILKIFSLELRFLSFQIRMDFPANTFYFILPVIFGDLGKKLLSFRLRLRSTTSRIFDEHFKSRLRNCLTAQIEKNKAKSNTMEYRIKDNEFSISF